MFFGVGLRSPSDFKLALMSLAKKLPYIHDHTYPLTLALVLLRALLHSPPLPMQALAHSCTHPCMPLHTHLSIFAVPCTFEHISMHALTHWRACLCMPSHTSSHFKQSFASFAHTSMHTLAHLHVLIYAVSLTITNTSGTCPNTLKRTSMYALTRSRAHPCKP